MNIKPGQWIFCNLNAMKKSTYTGLFIVLMACIQCSQPSRDDITWKSIEKDLQTQFIMAEEGDTIELPEGYFMFTRSLIMDGKSNITIKGKGIDKTFLSWKNQAEGAEGMRISNGKNITLEDFTVEDAKGDNLKVNDTRNLVLRRIRSQWVDGPKTENGAYALYPVLCKNVLMEECVAMGSCRHLCGPV
jgi:parallel beta-helix repeat protein